MPRRYISLKIYRIACDFPIFTDNFGIFCGIAVMENLHTEDRAAEEVLIGCFVEC